MAKIMWVILVCVDHNQIEIRQVACAWVLELNIRAKRVKKRPD